MSDRTTKQPIPRDRTTIRLGIVFSTLLLIFSGVFARCAWLSIAQGEEGIARQNRYAKATEWVPAVRGTIRDARGFVLARDRASWVVAIDPWAASGRLAGHKLMKEAEEAHPARCEERIVALYDELLAFEGFAPIGNVALTREALRKDTRPKHKRQYRVVGRIESVEAYERFLEFRRGVHADRGSAFPMPRAETRREFPLGALALQVVGDQSTKGTPLFGVEARFDDVLSGKRGIDVRQVDAIGRNAYALGRDESSIAAERGADIALTIDLPAQIVVESVLEDTLERTGATMVTGIVLDPRTGAVIAAASVPTCVRGEYQSFFPSPTEEDPEPEVDRRAYDSQLMASLFCLEPGSMLKPLVLARALEDRVVGLDTPVPVEGERNSIRYGRAVRHYTDSHALKASERNVRGSLVQSSNAGMGWVGAKMGEDRLKVLLRDLEFGRRTGFDLREDSGLRPDQRAEPPWNDHTTLSIPIGYEVLVTPLQVARAYCALANGGKLVTPYVVERVGGVPTTRPEPKQVFPAPITATIREVLREAVEIGTGKDLDADAIRLAGKTGTAAHYGAEGKIPGWYTSSFAGFAPVEDPRYVVVVTVERPDPKRYYASKTAAPAALEILRSLLGDTKDNRFDALLRDALAGSGDTPIIPGGMNEEGNSWGSDNPGGRDVPSEDPTAPAHPRRSTPRSSDRPGRTGHPRGPRSLRGSRRRPATTPPATTPPEATPPAAIGRCPRS